MYTNINRQDACKLLAKAISYKQSGKDETANIWAVKLVELLQCTQILKSEIKSELKSNNDLPF